jgi:hypothetical protein
MNATSPASAVTSPPTHTHANEIVAAKITYGLGVIGSKLKSGNLSAAQTAFSTYQQSVEGNSPFGMNSQANTDYQNLMADLQSGDLSAAQKDFVRLQTDLQPEKDSTKIGGFGLHHHGAKTGATTPITNGLTETSLPALTGTALDNIAPGSPTNSAMDSDAENDGSLLNVTV